MAAIQSLTADAIIALINAGSWPPNIPVTTGNTKLLGDVAFVDVHQASNLIFHLKNTGTATDTTGTVVFEGSINSTNGADGDWFAVQAARTNDNTIENSRSAATGSLAAGAAQPYGWEVSVVGLRWFRLRNTAAASAGANNLWTFSQSAEGSDPLPSVQQHPVTIQGIPNVAIPGVVAASITGTPTVQITGTPTVVTTPAIANAYSVVTTASTNAAMIKNAFTRLMEISIYNSTAATIYVKLYNKGSGAPAPATDGALILDIIPVAANTRVGIEYGAGKLIPNGLGIAVTGAAAVADATNTAAGAIVALTYI